MPSVELKEAAELTVIFEQNDWVLVKFSANWCEPCQLLAPTFERVVQHHPDLQGVSVNVDSHPELTRNYAVRSVPTLLLFKQGEIASQLSGLHNEGQLNVWLNQNVKAKDE